MPLAPQPGSADFPPTAIYLRLTAEFNRDHQRTIISSGQACVMYRLSMVSKDGDWITTEDPADLDEILTVLERHGARYRLGAPLDARWLAAGWSSHLQFNQDDLRIRTDFVSRPPRISPQRLGRIWDEVEKQELPVLPIPDLIAIKRTQRDRDYPIIGALALRLTDPEEILLHSIAPNSLSRTIAEHQELTKRCTPRRPALADIAKDPQRCRIILMEERLAHMAADRDRLAAYGKALAPWSARWQQLESELAELPLRQAHLVMVQEASKLLPQQVQLP